MKSNKKDGMKQIGRSNPEEVVHFEDIAAEIARLNGIDQGEINKMLQAMTEYWREKLEKYGETDFLGAGRLVVTDSPDVDFEFIPYPEEVTEMKYRIAMQQVFGGNEGAIKKGSGKDRN